MADLSFLETDSNEIYEDIITSLEERVGEPLYPGDERRVFGDALVALFVAVFNEVNNACKQKMLQYASGEVLDALGARYNCTRLQPTAAETVLRFSVKEAMPSNIFIAKGTRVTPDNEIYFETIESAVLQAGSFFVDVEAKASEPGASYNGYTVDTIKQLVDMVPYIDEVTNIEQTHGGDDGEPYPTQDDGSGDEHYRERIQLAPTSLSAAGPEDSYRYYAQSADASIADVAIISDVEIITKTLTLHGGCAFLGGRELLVDSLVVEGCTLGTDYTVSYEDALLKITFLGDKASAESVNITINQEMAGKVLIVPILKGGVIPDEDVLNKISEICSADDVRPMTDLVEVRAPEQVKYDIEIVYYTSGDEESDCVNTIEGTGGSLEQYIEWQGTKMGRDINPDKLRSLCLAPASGTGCHRIEVVSPSHTTIGRTQIAVFSGNLTVSHVVEED